MTVDAALYDELFGEVGNTNAEGLIFPAPFTAKTVQRYASNEPTQAAGALACCDSPWRHRPTLLA